MFIRRFLDWYAPLLFLYKTNKFSQDMAHFYEYSDFIHQIGNEIGEIAHAKGMSPSVDDARGGRVWEGGSSPSCWGGGYGGPPPENF